MSGGADLQHNNKRLYTAITTALFLPLILIVFLFIRYSQHAASMDGVTAVRLTHPDGEVSSSEPGSSVFTEILLDDIKLKAPPISLQGLSPVKLDIEYGDRTVSYDMYLVPDETKCFLVTESLEYIQIAPEYAHTLLLSPEFSYVYPDHLLPELTFTSGDTAQKIDPRKYSWRYEKTDGLMYDSDSTSIYVPTAERFTVVDGVGASFSFTRQPDVVKVTYTNQNGELLHESDSLSPVRLNVPDDTAVNININATWYADGERLSNGTAEYLIQILYDIPESFTLSSDTVSPGDMLIIYADQLDVTQDIDVETDLKSCGVRFIQYNGQVFSFLPVHSSNKGGVYTLKLTVSGRETVFTINVESTTYDAKFYNPDKQLSENAAEELAQMLRQVDSRYESVPYFNDSDPFDAPLTGELHIPYGSDVFYTDSPVSQKADGLLWLVDSGTTVRAAASGRVIYVGETERYGKTVVIDHGLGVKTYYCHLQSTDVLENVVVSAGAAIGKSGNSGFTIGDMMYFAVSVNGTFIDPQYVISDGIELP